MVEKCPPHRYKKKNLTKTKNKDPYYVFACIECTHFVRADLVSGKEARCFNCNTPFIVNKKKAIKQSKLRCDNCIKKKDSTIKMEKAVESVLDDILDDIFK